MLGAMVLILINASLASYLATKEPVIIEAPVIQVDTVRDIEVLDTVYTNETKHLHYRADTFLDSATIMGISSSCYGCTSFSGWRWVECMRGRHPLLV